MVDTAFLNGLLLGLSLIIAIGAQNAMVIKMGILGSNIFIIALFCAVSDAALIAVGVGGGGFIFQQFPIFIDIMRWAGVLYIAYFIKNLIAEMRNPHAMELNQDIQGKLSQNIKQIAAVTWLNPHVYLDTVGLISSVSAPFTGMARLYFALGAMTASFLWFFTIIYGAKSLAPILNKPTSWRIINFIILFIMLYIITTLVVGV